MKIGFALMVWLIAASAVAQVNPASTYTLAIWPPGTTGTNGIITAAAAPKPIATIPLAAASFVCNQPAPTPWPLPPGSPPLVLATSLTDALVTIDDPKNAGKVCQLDVLPQLTPLLASLTINAVYPVGLQGIDTLGQPGAWAVSADPFVRPAGPPAVPTHLAIRP
jgi:hypothetical protein